MPFLKNDASLPTEGLDAPHAGAPSAWRAPGAHPGGRAGALPRAGLGRAGAWWCFSLDGGSSSPSSASTSSGKFRASVSAIKTLRPDKGFVCPKWLERSFAFLGGLLPAGQPVAVGGDGSPSPQHADDEPDPHSQSSGFLVISAGCWSRTRPWNAADFTEVTPRTFCAMISTPGSKTERCGYGWSSCAAGIFRRRARGRTGARMAFGEGRAVWLEPVAMA